jgi:hypothetical protein
MVLSQLPEINWPTHLVVGYRFERQAAIDGVYRWLRVVPVITEYSIHRTAAACEPTLSSLPVLRSNLLYHTQCQRR